MHPLIYSLYQTNLLLFTPNFLSLIFNISFQNVTVQGISGTGSLRIGAEMLKKWYPGSKDIYLPSPTWGNHNPLFKFQGLNLKTYRYYNPTNCGFDFEGALDDISVVIFFYIYILKKII